MVNHGDTDAGPPPLEGRARAFMIVAGIDVVLMVTSASILIWYVTALSDPVGLAVNPGLLDLMVTATTWVGGLHFFMFGLSAVLLLVSHHRVRHQLRDMRGDGLSYTPGWAIAWWFIPRANLFMPFLVMRETWKATEAAANWQYRGSSIKMKIWWIAFIADNVLSGVASAYQQDARTLDQISSAIYMRLGDVGLTGLSAVLLILIVRDVTRRMHELRGTFVAEVFE